MMAKCIHHPDRETAYKCMKHEIAMCTQCLKCRDPELYCKHRSSCAIHFMTRDGNQDWIDDAPDVSTPTSSASAK